MLQRSQMRNLSPSQKAQIELEIRRRGLRTPLSFTDWLTKTQPLLTWDAPHLELIREKLMDVVEGRVKKLMIFTPPRHGKSQQNTISLPAWYLERWPERRVIIGAYNATLSEKFSRKARKLTRAKLSNDRTAVDDWETVAGGGLRAVGVGGGITGMGGNLILIDDPVKSREEANSPRYRDKCWDWYTDDLYTRLEPGGAIVLTMTRWHDDDLAGRILASDDGPNWEVITLPALATHNDLLGRAVGDALWPDRYDEAALAEIRSILGPNSFNALYQQNPIPDEGDFFKAADCQWYETPPKHLHIYGASDYAVLDGEGDFTEHGVFGVDPNDDLYILDWWYDQTTADKWIESLLDLVNSHKPLFWVGEGGVIRRAIEPFLVKRSRERRVYARFEWLNSIHDKPTRARAFQARWAMRKVYLPKNVPWADRLLAQLTRFPAGSKDDAVDVCSLIGRALDEIHGATLPVDDTKPKKDAWDKRFDGDGDEDDWKVN